MALKVLALDVARPLSDNVTRMIPERFLPPVLQKLNPVFINLAPVAQYFTVHYNSTGHVDYSSGYLRLCKCSAPGQQLNTVNRDDCFFTVHSAL